MLTYQVEKRITSILRVVEKAPQYQEDLDFGQVSDLEFDMS